MQQKKQKSKKKKNRFWNIWWENAMEIQITAVPSQPRTSTAPYGNFQAETDPSSNGMNLPPPPKKATIRSFLLL
jgi:hypothetical protein